MSDVLLLECKEKLIALNMTAKQICAFVNEVQPACGRHSKIDEPYVLVCRPRHIYAIRAGRPPPVAGSTIRSSRMVQHILLRIRILMRKTG